jgi:hypothetical protein
MVVAIEVVVARNDSSHAAPAIAVSTAGEHGLKTFPLLARRSGWLSQLPANEAVARDLTEKARAFLRG